VTKRLQWEGKGLAEVDRRMQWDISKDSRELEKIKGG
jgi:hypothetical protein